jgi:3-oxoacyl-[acyl-carrier-protein] synthase II
MKRVVVTGLSAITALGNTWDSVFTRIRAGDTAIRYMPGWEAFTLLRPKLAAPISDFEAPAHFGRKVTRSMGRVALLAVASAEQAVADAGLRDAAVLKSGAFGVSYGSSVGSTTDWGLFGNALTDASPGTTDANTFLRLMPHTTAVNIGVYLGLKGRVIPTSSACTSGSHGIGYAYEAIKWGKQKGMVAGGAEELCASDAFVFDTLYAASIKNDTPALTPRPFDAARDGLVVGEGAGTLVLEELESALKRGATIHAELVGYATNSDGAHVTKPMQDTMELAMRQALDDAGLRPEQVGYVNAHGTGTEQGDIAESQATFAVFGSGVPVSTQKGHLGHTLGACGGIEAWLTIGMLNRQWFPPTANLTSVDSRCGALDYIRGSGRELRCDYAMTNNFAFGGINTSLIFRRWSGA